MMGEIVELGKWSKWHKWQRYFRQLARPQAGPSEGTAMPTTPTTVCVFEHRPNDEPLLLWPSTPKPPTPPRSAVVLNWPKPPRS
jgi:hypothetical protein